MVEAKKMPWKTVRRLSIRLKSQGVAFTSIWYSHYFVEGNVFEVFLEAVFFSFKCSNLLRI